MPNFGDIMWTYKTDIKAIQKTERKRKKQREETYLRERKRKKKAVHKTDSQVNADCSEVFLFNYGTSGSWIPHINILEKRILYFIKAVLFTEYFITVSTSTVAKATQPASALDSVQG